ncbi:hypothetical protein ACFYY8_31280 [Streptosporangium sp. NPDC001559]|uniref:hypothetical protein n=1 Tax=Streptosporangium sp. NPDC001559 TaxID=3366187 RepID=UPI0036E770D2
MTARPVLAISPRERHDGLHWRLDIPRTVPGLRGHAESRSRDTVRGLAQSIADEFDCDIEEVEPGE